MVGATYHASQRSPWLSNVIVSMARLRDGRGQRMCSGLLRRLRSVRLWSEVVAQQESQRAPRPRPGAGHARQHSHVTGPFFHGTRSALSVGDELVAGRGSNFQTGRVSNNIYFADVLETAVWGAELATALAAAVDDAGPADRGRVYVVEPSGPFEDDPNVTDKKFPGNPTGSYRSRHPLRVVGEAHRLEGPFDPRCSTRCWPHSRSCASRDSTSSRTSGGLNRSGGGAVLALEEQQRAARRRSRRRSTTRPMTT